MIRDPSDGSVRETKDGSDLSSPLDRIGGGNKMVSGLPLESTKPDRKERLDKSREWLKQYFNRNPEQGA